MCNLGKSLRWIGRVLFALALLLSSSRSVEAGEITLAWDPVTDTDIAGYVVFFGTAPGSYSENVVLTDRTSWTGTNLIGGQLYYFAVSAFSTSGVHSPLSVEISAIVPVPTSPAEIAVPPPASTLPGSTVQFDWLAGMGGTEHRLSVGTTLGGTNLFDQVEGASLSRTVTGLPTHGGAVFVRLWTLIGSTWRFVDYTYTAAPPPSTRIISLTGSLAFGTVTVGATATRTLTITNNGTSALTVSSISYPAGFSGDWSSGSIAAGGTQTVTVTFAPAATTTYGGAVTVTSNHTDGTATMSTGGTAINRIGIPGDLNGDRAVDLLWRQTQNGDVSVSATNSLSAAQASLASVPVAWQIAGVADIDGDSLSDLVWREKNTGDVAIWFTHLSNGSSVGVGSAPLVASRVPLAWQIAGVRDLDGDGKADLVWRNTQTGDVAAWLMDGATVRQGPLVAAGVPLSWQLGGLGDLDGDGKADLVWRNTQTGDVAVWLMDGVTVKEAPLVATGVPAAWQIAGVGDLDGDGNADLVWRNTQTGDVASWQMRGASVKSTPVVASGVPTAWQIVKVADVDGDGKADLVWRHMQTGDVAEWLMDGATVRQSLIVAFGVPLTSQIQP